MSTHSPASPPASPCVLVTRPLHQAQAWAQALCAQGVNAEVLPLIEIAPAPDAAPVQAAWRVLQGGQTDAVMFVSANAVAHFMAQAPAGVHTGVLARTQAWSTGPGTEAALRQAGWPPAQIVSPPPQSPAFDSEALWACLQRRWSAAPQGPGALKVLIVRGADASGELAGRDWLAQQLLQAGAQLTQCVAYVRRAPVWDTPTLARARLALARGDWWLFSSSEAALHLQQALPGQALGAHAHALATHARIAQRLQALGWARVVTVPATLQGQVASIESLS